MRIIYLIVLLLPFSVTAQSSFKPGYVILNNGDSLRGKIEEGNWSLNPEVVHFRDEKGDHQYGVRDVQAFGIDEEVQFVRFHVTFQRTATELNDATETFDGPVEVRDILLRVLYRGKHSLFELGTSKRKYFFVQTEGGDLKELIYRVRLNPTGVLEKDQQYKSLLGGIAMEEGKEEALRNQISGMNYQTNDMVKIISMLNGGAGIFKEPASLLTKFDISGGPTVYIFNPGGRLYNDGTGAYAIYAAEFNSTFGFTAGLGLTYYSKRNRGKIQSRLGLNFSYMKIDGLNTSGAGSFQEEEYSGSLILAEPNISLDFRLGGDGQTVFLLGGVFGINITIINNFSSTFRNPGVNIERKNFPPANGGFFTAGLNATLQMKRSRLNFRGYLFSNIFDSPHTKLNGNGLSFTYGYFLKN